MKTTQYDKIYERLVKAGPAGVAYHDLARITNWPHKRLAEMESRGLELIRWQELDKSRLRSMMALRYFSA